MHRFLRPAAVAAILAAFGCSHATPTTAPAPAAPPPAQTGVKPAGPPAPIPSALVPLPDVPAAPFAGKDALPKNWQQLDQDADHVAGVSSERAMKELLAGKQPKRTVLVAVIDGGVDTAHADLRANLWVNPKEVARNQRDDDGNGYMDDIHGWNFIGGRDGRNVDHDTFEATRIEAGCKKRAPEGDVTKLPPVERKTCERAIAEFDKQMNEMTMSLTNVKQIDAALTYVTATLKTALKVDSLTDSLVMNLPGTTPDIVRAKGVYQQLQAQGLSRHAVDEALKEINSRLKYGLDPNFNPRAIVGDDTLNLTERGYGNGDVMGGDASHGTHVSGIIGAVRGNSVGVDGIAPAVKIMMVRAVPDGDERDKDIANAIRYAVDNGAQVINMSFGKPFSPGKAVVDEAVKYADAHGVLMIHAAGNDGENIDSTESYPTPRYLGGGRPANWIEVGASSWKGADDLAAEFSNYGKATVDLFAPGVDILSTVPGGGYERESGTSMATPVVSGVAALVMAYYPELTATDVKSVLINSVSRHPNQMVTVPGGDKKVPFGSLSMSGGIINAYAALKLAAQIAGRKAQ